MDPVRVGVIGYGFSAKCFHLPFITSSPECRLYAILQRAEAPKDAKSAEPGSHCTVDHPTAKHYRTADEFFADPQIEVVIVCTKMDTHTSYAVQALESGKHGMWRGRVMFFITDGREQSWWKSRLPGRRRRLIS